LAIAISAVLFALIHLNPAQMPHAFAVGLLLGWLYYRTDSVVPGVVYHWINNTTAYVVYNFYPDPSLHLIDFFGSQRSVAAAVMFSLFIFLPSLYQLNMRLRKAA
jgi:membrane protease YdiL (CAAX protease family)